VANRLADDFLHKVATPSVFDDIAFEHSIKQRAT
jgi:hypothetical protein